MLDDKDEFINFKEEIEARQREEAAANNVSLEQWKDLVQCLDSDIKTLINDRFRERPLTKEDIAILDKHWHQRFVERYGRAYCRPVRNPWRGDV